MDITKVVYPSIAHPIFRIGSGEESDVTKIKCLFARCTQGNKYSVLQSPQGINYQVPADKISVITKILVSTDEANGNFNFQWGISAVHNSETPPDGYLNLTEFFYMATVNIAYNFDVFIPFPAEKYPHIFAQAGSCVLTAFGIEVDNPA
ncbi:unnamed protein product, partial [marine sediment metagenome]